MTLCACGQPLHYSNPKTEAQVRTVVERMGPNIRVETPDGVYEVQRHYIALHGIAAAQIPQLAEELGFSKVA